MGAWLALGLRAVVADLGLVQRRDNYELTPRTTMTGLEHDTTRPYFVCGHPYFVCGHPLLEFEQGTFFVFGFLVRFFCALTFFFIHPKYSTPTVNVSLMSVLILCASETLLALHTAG